MKRSKVARNVCSPYDATHRTSRMYDTATKLRRDVYQRNSCKQPLKRDILNSNLKPLKHVCYAEGNKCNYVRTNWYR